MKIPETVSLNVNNQKYQICKGSWEHFKEMHPVRTKEAFEHFISGYFLLQDRNVSSKEIEEYISEEYEMFLHLDETVKKARELYEKSI